MIYISTKNNIKHGLRKHPLYTVHRDILNRCYLKTRHSYNNYGGRGIAVCEEWKSDFKAFYDWAISNGWQPGLEIDRINNNGNYEPSNCRCTTSKVNAQNRRNSHNLTWNGVTMNLAEWAIKSGIHYKLLYKRIKYENLSIGEAITIKRNYKRLDTTT